MATDHFGSFAIYYLKKSKTFLKQETWKQNAKNVGKKANIRCVSAKLSIIISLSGHIVETFIGARKIFVVDRSPNLQRRIEDTC